MPVKFLWVIAIAVLILDRISKRWVQSHMAFGESFPLLGRWLRMSHCRNTGGAFSVLTGQTHFFLAVGVIVTAWLVMLLPKIAKLPASTSIAYALILGGAVGNLWDRFKFGFVVDFIDFGRDSNWWPVFNVADSGITLGIIMLGWAVFRGNDTFPSSAAPVAGDSV